MRRSPQTHETKSAIRHLAPQMVCGSAARIRYFDRPEKEHRNERIAFQTL